MFCCCDSQEAAAFARVPTSCVARFEGLQLLRHPSSAVRGDEQLGRRPSHYEARPETQGAEKCDEGWPASSSLRAVGWRSGSCNHFDAVRALGTHMWQGAYREGGVGSIDQRKEGSPAPLTWALSARVITSSAGPRWGLAHTFKLRRPRATRCEPMSGPARAWWAVCPWVGEGHHPDALPAPPPHTYTHCTRSSPGPESPTSLRALAGRASQVRSMLSP